MSHGLDSIRTTRTRFVRAVAASATLWLWCSTSTADGDVSGAGLTASLDVHPAPLVPRRPPPGEVTDRLEDLVKAPGLTARLSAWDLELDQLHRLIDALDATQRQRLAASWQKLSAESAAGDASTDRLGMYLKLLVELRDAQFFLSVISNRL